MIKKYKQFNESLEFPNTEEEIHKACKIYSIRNYTINEDMSIDVDNLYLQNLNLNKLPLNFNIINGHFYCYRNNLTSLIGCPKSVNGNFSCANNKLISLEGMPHIIYGDIHCQYNMIKSFKWAPEYFNKGFYCIGNPIYEVYRLFEGNNKAIYWINEFDVIQGDNIIIERLEEVFLQLDMEVPNLDKDNFTYYNYNLI